MTAMRWPALVLVALLASATGTVRALSPSEVYDRAAPSVWRVVTYDGDGVPLGFGSGVVIGPDTLVTNCHVLAKARRVSVKRDGKSVDARLELWDPPRDVCQIRAPNLGAPAVKLGDAEQLKVGQNVYAIGSPQGLDLTMSAGLLSSIRRNERRQIVLLQTSAAISRGSSGGGLFDEDGVLIGLTTIGSVRGDAQNLNFAIPVDWVRDLPDRHARLLAGQGGAASSATAPRPEALPLPTRPPAASAVGP
jgi:S1-C subfamily serine protease